MSQYCKIGGRWFVGERDSKEPLLEIPESEVPPLLLLLTDLSEQGHDSSLAQVLKKPH